MILKYENVDDALQQIDTQLLEIKELLHGCLMFLSVLIIFSLCFAFKPREENKCIGNRPNKSSKLLNKKPISQIPIEELYTEKIENK
jgi:hypothetical protein